MALLWIGNPVAAQADAPSPDNARVYRDRVKANWLSDGVRFWYRNDLPDGQREFVLVDAERGFRKPAFDHDRAGAALAQFLGQDSGGNALRSVESIEFADDGERIRLQGHERAWVLDPANHKITDAPADEKEENRLAAHLEPRPSGSNGSETTIVFVNQTEDEVKLFWSDLAGTRQPYGSLKPGETRPQHTFAQHVWLATRRDGTVLAVFEAAARQGLAVIDGKAQAKPNEERASRRSSNRHSGLRSPDGRYEVFVRDHNLWLRDFESNEERALSTDGNADHTYGSAVYRDATPLRGDESTENEDGERRSSSRPRVAWSPDSKRLVAMRTRVVDERRVYMIESSPRDRVQPRLQSYRYPKPGDELPVSKPRVFDVEKGQQIPVADDLFPDPFDLGEPRWSADGSRFTFLYNQRGHQVLRVIEVEAATGAARAIVDEQSKTFIDYSGKQFREDLDATGEMIWMSERDGWNHLYLYDVAAGRVKNQITRGEWVVRGVERVDAERRQIWVRAGGIRPGQDPYHVHFCRVNFDGSELTVLTEGDGTHAIEFSPDGQFFIDTYSRVDLPPVNELRRSANGSLVCRLEQADTSEFTSSGRSLPERFAAKGRDGVTDIYGILYRPHDFDPAKRYPVIESIYAGPHAAHVPKSFSRRYPQQQRLADRGFIIVQIDGMGTSHRSKAFHDVCWKNLADAGFPDRIAWMRAAAESRAYMDLSRVGIYGGSAGGQNALGALLFHGDFYDAAAADCGCHDNRMDKIWWNEQWMGAMGPHYAENSNVTHAHRLNGALLLIVGELDRNVDPASTMQVVDALVRADKDFDLLVIPSAGHGAGGSPYGQRRTTDFFVRHLLDSNDPSSAAN